MSLKAKNYNILEVKKALAPLKVSVVEQTIKNITTHNPNPDFENASKIEALQSKSLTILSEKDINILANQIEILESKIEDLTLKNKQFVTEITILIENQFAKSANHIEKNISDKLIYYNSTLEKRTAEFSTSFAILNDVISKRLNKIEETSLDHRAKTEILNDKYSNLGSVLNEIIQKVLVLEVASQKSLKNQKSNFYIICILILLTFIATISVCLS